MRRAADRHRQRHVVAVDPQLGPHRLRHRPGGLVGVDDQIVLLVGDTHAQLVEVAARRPAETGAEPVVREERLVLRLVEAGAAAPRGAVAEDRRRAGGDRAVGAVGPERSAAEVVALAVAARGRWVDGPAAAPRAAPAATARAGPGAGAPARPRLARHLLDADAADGEDRAQQEGQRAWVLHQGWPHFQTIGKKGARTHGGDRTWGRN